MNVPTWADEKLSIDLPNLRLRGEGSSLEFKVDFPAQGHSLAKDVAALCSSGGGTILIGVDDDGTLAGLAIGDAAEANDAKLRAHGIARGISPTPHVDIAAAVENGKTVIIISIPRQEEPVFYYDHRPYIRDGTSSRPAEPDEVKELIWASPSSEMQRHKERVLMRAREAFQEHNNELQRIATRQVQQNAELAVEQRRRFLEGR